jgi:hypothetical protein
MKGLLTLLGGLAILVVVIVLFTGLYIFLCEHGFGVMDYELSPDHYLEKESANETRR